MKDKVLEKKLLTAGHSTIWAYFFDGKEIGKSKVGKKIKTYCKNKLAGKVKYTLYVSSDLFGDVRNYGDLNAVKFFDGSVENEMAVVEKEFTSHYSGGKWKDFTLVPLKEIEAVKIADVDDYAVTSEAFEIAVQAEIDNANAEPEDTEKFEVTAQVEVVNAVNVQTIFNSLSSLGIIAFGKLKKPIVDHSKLKKPPRYPSNFP